MHRYFLQRTLLAVPTLFGISILVFAIVRLIPGGAEAAFCPQGCTEEDAHRIKQALGLDRPLLVQYWAWLTSLLSGDLGRSLHSYIPVGHELRARLPVTLELSTLALAVALLIALPVGVLAAVRQDSALDYLARGIAVATLSMPGFWLATLVIAYGGQWFHWAPPVEYRHLLEHPAENLLLMTPPALILGASISGSIMRLVRAQLLEVLRQDYIRTARAKGLSQRSVVIRHALRNALLPVVTLLGLQVPSLMSGTVILESIFQIPGMGQYLVGAIGLRDFPVIQGVNLLVATVVVFANLAVDLSYAWLDPRIRYE